MCRSWWVLVFPAGVVLDGWVKDPNLTGSVGRGRRDFLAVWAACGVGWRVCLVKCGESGLSGRRVDFKGSLFQLVGLGLRMVEDIPADFGIERRGVFRYFVWYGIVVFGALSSFAD